MGGYDDELHNGMEKIAELIVSFKKRGGVVVERGVVISGEKPGEFFLRLATRGKGERWGRGIETMVVGKRSEPQLSLRYAFVSYTTLAAALFYIILTPPLLPLTLKKNSNNHKRFDSEFHPPRNETEGI